MIKLNVKPLSQNEAYQGRRYHTKKYESFILECLYKLQIKHKEMFQHKNIELWLVFYFSTKAADLTNPIKLFEDTLSKKYGFNDNCVMDLHVKKRRCKKGEERIEFYAKESEYKW